MRRRKEGTLPWPRKGCAPPPPNRSKGPRRATSRERTYLGGKGAQNRDPAVMQHLVDLLQSLGVSQQVVQEVQQAVQKNEPRVVEEKEHT